ncbi:MAG: hypothetical protein FWE82_06540, partial [Defluviitaleaceae bacterium]|nr:hypothetical protein [Defluviitaleaceae bacterium]
MQTDDVNFSHDKLINVLTKMLRAEIIVKDFSVSKLHGGTVGDVSLISGDAKTDCGKILPFKVVLKTQKKWERYNDPGSWRREYDFYKSGFENFFDGKLRWPECFHAEMNEAEDQWQAWTEYAEGATGNDLTVEMCAKAAYELGKLQGRLYARKPDILKNFANLSGVDAVKQYYQYYRSWHEVYDYVRAADYITPSCTFNVCHPELAKGLEDSSPAAQNDNCTFSVCLPELAKGLEDSSPAAQNDNCTFSVC